MNKTISIALAGFSFIIEEQAYTKLNNYLNALRGTLEQEEADEVMYDIEIRITEILKESLGKREVVNDDDVEKVIAQIGTPEAIGEQEAQFYSERTTTQKTYAKKQLFRDEEGGKLGGVCAGLAHYVGIDVSIMRVLWVIAFFLTAGTTIFVYFILWMVMPKAETTTDFLKMKGKPVDFDHIKEESVRFANESGKKIGEFYHQHKSTMAGAGKSAVRIVRKFLGSIFGILGFLFLLAGAVLVFAVIGQVDVSGVRELEFLFPGYLRYTFAIMIALTLLAFIVFFTSLSIKLFSPKTKIRYWLIVSALLFGGMLGVAGYFGMQMEGLNLAGTNREEERIALKSRQNSIEIGINRIEIPSNFEAYDNGNIFSDKKRIFDKDNRPSISIIRRDAVAEPYLIITKKAKGYNHRIRVNAPVKVQDGRIDLPNYIAYDYEDRFRDYDVDYELIIPNRWQVIDRTGGAVDIDEENEDYDKDIDIEYHNGGIHIEMPKDTIKVQRS